MVSYSVFLILLSAASLAIVLLLLKLFKPAKKGAILIVIVSVLLYTATLLIPAKHGFHSYDSPEEAFAYKNRGTVVQTIQGVKSALVIAKEKDNAYAMDVVAKVENGWQATTGLSLRNDFMTTFGTVSIHIYRFQNTEDYYISISDIMGDELALKDSEESTFFKIEDVYTAADTVIFNRTYYAHIAEPAETYALTINGETCYPYRK